MAIKILIIDDNYDLADGLAAVLETEGYQPTVCYDGKSALSALQQQDFDICLIDVKLPDTNGIELFRQVITLQPNTRVALMTGYRIDQMLAEANQQREVMLFRNMPDDDVLVESLEKLSNGGIILLTDSSSDIVTTIEESLASHNWTSSIISGSQSLKVLKSSHEPKQVIVDFNRPVICSLDTHLSLRDEGLNHPMIIITPDKGSTDVDNPLHCISVTGCLFKPFDTAFVLKALNKLLMDNRPEYQRIV